MGSAGRRRTAEDEARMANFDERGEFDMGGEGKPGIVGEMLWDDGRTGNGKEMTGG